MISPRDGDITAAAHDYRWLLDRGYPDQGALKLVGDRYRLSRTGRAVLYRGVFSARDSRRRSGRLAEVSQRAAGSPGASGAVEADAGDPNAAARGSGAGGKDAAARGNAGGGARRSPVRGDTPPASEHSGPFIVDGHNVLFTVWNCLAGRPVVRATDGFIRDIAGTRARLPHDERFTRIATLLCEALLSLAPPAISVYLDEQLPWSREHAGEIRELWRVLAQGRPPGASREVHADARSGSNDATESAVPPPFTVDTHRSVDGLVAATTEGLIATSDTAVVDRCAVPVLDLGGLIVTVALEREPPDMAALIAEAARWG